jgi:hypothetical protein
MHHGDWLEVRALPVHHGDTEGTEDREYNWE